MTQVALKEHQVCVRKDLWTAVKEHYARMNAAFNLTPFRVMIEACGLIVGEDEREMYCDGRSEPKWIATQIENRKKVFFLPLVERQETTA